MGQEGAGQGELLQDALAGEVEADVVLEDDGNHRVVELGDRAHRLDAGQPLELERQRVGHLVLDLLGAAAHPVGEDDDLVLAQVRDGVHRRVEHGVDCKYGQGGRQNHHQIAVTDRILDEFFNHGTSSFRGRPVTP